MAKVTVHTPLFREAKSHDFCDFASVARAKMRF
jgi:hypothetical protein